MKKKEWMQKLGIFNASIEDILKRFQEIEKMGNWATAVDKLKELEAKVNSINGHQNRSDQDLSHVKSTLAEQEFKLTNAKGRLTALERAKRKVK